MLAMVVITQFGGVENMVWMSLVVCLWLWRDPRAAGSTPSWPPCSAAAP